MLIDGIEYEVDWRRFKPGRSIFIPCLDIKAAKAEVDRVTRRLQIEVEYKWTVHGGIGGLRIWRV